MGAILMTSLKVGLSHLLKDLSAAIRMKDGRGGGRGRWVVADPENGNGNGNGVRVTAVGGVVVVVLILSLFCCLCCCGGAFFSPSFYSCECWTKVIIFLS